MAQLIHSIKSLNANQLDNLHSNDLWNWSTVQRHKVQVVNYMAVGQGMQRMQETHINLPIAQST